MRKPREYSESGFYHTIVQGVDKQNLFYDNSDRYLFISLLTKYSYQLKIEVHSYVLMDNHIHLLLKDTQNHISQFMQNVTSVYARIFNKKYDRIGHLFNDRFQSKTIEDTDYLLNCFHYIMNNPEKAKISKINTYKWSSYNCYKSNKTFVTTDLLKQILGGEDQLYKFLHSKPKNNEEIFFLEPKMRYSEKIRNIYQKICSLIESTTPIIHPDLPADELAKKIKILINAKIPVTTISRITTVNRSYIKRIQKSLLHF